MAEDALSPGETDLVATLTAAVRRGTGIPDAEPRPGQLALALDVWRAFDGADHHATCAPTGSGKTMATGVPALLRAAIYGERTIISTESLSLQAQILDKDAPVMCAAVEAATGTRPTVAVHKGWSNWICPVALLHSAGEHLTDERATELASAALDKASDGGGAFVTRDGARELRDPQAIRAFLRDLSARVQPTAADGDDVLGWAVGQLLDIDAPGDRHSCPTAFDARSWSRVSVSPAECVGATDCPFASMCKAARARTAAAEADVVVTNHTLLAVQAAKAVTAVTGSRSLGEFHHLIIDEAHALPGQVRAQGAGEVSGDRLRSLVRAVAAVLDDRDPAVGDVVTHGRRLAAILDDRLAEATTSLDPGAVRRLRSCRDVAGGVWDDIDAWYSAANRLLRGAGSTLAVRRVSGRISAAAADLSDAADGDPALARWVERGREGAPAVKLSPVDVSGLLRANLWQARALPDADEYDPTTGEEQPASYPLSVTCVSATLPAGFEREAGLDTTVVARPTPFTDAYERSLLLVPRATDQADVAILSRPGTSGRGPAFGVDGHAVWARGIAARLVEAAAGHALVLTATSTAGRAMAAALRDRAAGRWQVLDQWSGVPVRQVVGQWRDDPSAVLVGTKSLMTGTDAPGTTCRLVIVDRVPRAAPNPVDEARVEAMMGRLDSTNLWAVDHLVYGADAALLLEQAAGRLIRSTSDDGVVAVLDPRLLRAGQTAFQYGAAARKLYLGALEAFTSRTTRIEHALEWLNSPAPSQAA